MQLNVITLTEEKEEELMARAIKRAIKEAKEEKSLPEGWLSTKELSTLFPYSMEWFRDRINEGKFGKKAINGDCMAKYKEVEKYLFHSKY